MICGSTVVRWSPALNKTVSPIRIWPVLRSIENAAGVGPSFISRN
jgi:hypothetical protein